MNLSPEEIADMRLSDPELYTSMLESQLEMMHAQMKHRVQLDEMVKKSILAKLTKEQARSAAMDSQLKEHESLKEQFYQLECDSDMLSNTNEQLRRRVDDQKAVIQELTAAIVRILDHNAAEPAEETADCYINAQLLLQSLQRGALPGSAASVASLSDDEATPVPIAATGGFRTFFSSLVTKFTAVPEPESAPSTADPAAPSLDTSFRALIDELGSAAVAPYVPASVLSQLPQDPQAGSADSSTAPPTGVLTAWLQQHERAAASHAAGSLRVVADATSGAMVRIPAVTGQTTTPAPAPADEAELTVLQMLYAIAPASSDAPADHSSTGTDADIEGDSASSVSDDDELTESSLSPEAILSGAQGPTATQGVRLTGFPATADVDRMTQRLRSKRVPVGFMSVPDAALGGLVRARSDPDAERRHLMDKIRMDERNKLAAERTFLEVFGSRMLEEFLKTEDARRADFQRHVTNIRTHLREQPAAAGREEEVVQRFEQLYHYRRAQQFNEGVDEKLRSGLLRILNDPNASWKAQEQAHFIISRGTTLTANDDLAPVSKVLLQHLDEEEFCGRLGVQYEELKPALERIEQQRTARLQEEARRDVMRMQRKRAINMQVKKRGGEITDYRGGFAPMKLVGQISKGIEQGVDLAVSNITGNRD